MKKLSGTPSDTRAKKSQCSTFYIFFFNFYSSSGKKIITTWKNIFYPHRYGKKRKIRILDLFPLKLLIKFFFIETYFLRKNVHQKL